MTKIFEKFAFLTLISFVLAFFASCADSLNEKHPDKCEKLAETIGTVYEGKKDSDESDNGGGGGSGGGSSENYKSDTISGTISNADGYVIYKFSAYSSVSYSISWTNGGGASMEVSAGSSSKSPSDYFSATTKNYQTVTPSYNTTVYIKVAPSSSSSTGSFSLTVSNYSGKTVKLETETFYAGTSTSSGGTTYAYSDSKSGTIPYGNGYYIYSFYAYSSATYAITFTNGTGTMAVSAETSTNYTYYKSAQTSSFTITPSVSGYIYVKIAPYNGLDSNAGSFTLIVGSSTRTVSLSQSDYSAGTSSTLTIADYYSSDITDYTEISVTSGKSSTYTVQMSSGYRYFLQWHHAASEQYATICKDNSKTAAKASLAIYEGNVSDENKFCSLTDESYGRYPLTDITTSQYNFVITPTSTGDVAIRLYRIPATSSVTNFATVCATDSNSSLNFTNISLTTTTPTFYKFNVEAGKTYCVHFIDSDIKAQSTVSSTYTYTDGICAVYSDEGKYLCFSDGEENLWFAAETSETVTLSVQKAWSGAENGYLSFRVYCLD